jgi:hypothetical protein
MTQEAINEANKVRAKTAYPVMLCPDIFKVCDSCWSISKVHIPICPVCHSYRWRTRIMTVLAAVRIMLRRADPFPVTLACPPRIITSA